MKKRKILCIKDFISGGSTLFQINQYYRVDFEDELRIIMKYPLTEYQKIFYKIYGEKNFDNRVQFFKVKNGKFFSTYDFNEYFSDRVAKLDKLSTVSFD
jgi:methenyltetrahydromethanopterin cyclohydrolase